jgi:uncharacterized repeat protein (TIGR01451 family)
MKNQIGSGSNATRLAIISVLFGVTLLGMMLVVLSNGDAMAMPSQVILAQATVPPQPTAPPPPLTFTKELTRGGCLSQTNQIGLAVCNNSCPTTPVTVTVGLYDGNPLVGTYPISAPFVALGGFREMRVQGIDCSDPTCASLLTAQFWYPGGAQNYKLWYWDPFDEHWKWVNQTMSPLSVLTYTQHVNTFFDCSNSQPSLSLLGAGMVFALGYTTTAEVPALSLAKFSTDADGPPLYPGDTLTYTLVVSNTGGAMANEVTVSDTVPAFTQYVANSISGGNTHVASGGVLTWSVDSLPVGADRAVTLTFAVTVNTPLTDGTQIVNTAAVTSTERLTPVLATVTDTVTSPPTGSTVFLPIVVKGYTDAP